MSLFGVEIDQLFSLVHLRNPTSETIHLLLCLGRLIYITSASGQLSDPRSKGGLDFQLIIGQVLTCSRNGKFTNFQSVQIANCPRQENWYSLLIQSKIPVVCQPKKVGAEQSSRNPVLGLMNCTYDYAENWDRVNIWLVRASHKILKPYLVG